MAGLKESQIIFKHRAMTPVQILKHTQFKNPVILKMLNIDVHVQFPSQATKNSW